MKLFGIIKVAEFLKVLSLVNMILSYIIKNVAMFSIKKVHLSQETFVKFVVIPYQNGII